MPDDFSVIGIDDHEMSALHDLTTVAQPVVEQGRIAAELLLELLRGDAPPADRASSYPPGSCVRATHGRTVRSRPRHGPAR